MEVNEVIEMLKTITHTTAGVSLRRVNTAYKIVEYIVENEDDSDLVDAIYDYYLNDFEENNEYGNTYIEELNSLNDLCSNILISDSKIIYEAAGVDYKEYTLKDMEKYLSFISHIEKRFNVKLKENERLLLIYTKGRQVNFKSELISAQKELQAVNKRLDKINFSMIEIISIFIAVIFALFGGTQLVCNVFNNLTENNYKIFIKAVIIIGFIFSIFISVLISIFPQIDTKKRDFIITLNKLYLVLCLITLIL